jgi:hypothetical protein
LPTAVTVISTAVVDQEFGLYDNDEQIMTLTGHDFEHVVNSNARVFVNFYSPGREGCDNG